MARSPAEPAPQRLECWFCSNRFTSRHVLRDGILRSRTERAGGPYRLYCCPECNRENLCEKSLGGRWFASPNCKLTVLDSLFTQVLDPDGAETILAALGWFRENEERRRYFFERDGDRRYAGRSLLARLWPWGPRQETAGRQSRRTAPREPRPDTPPRAKAPADPPPRARAGSRVLSPWEVLGVREGATEAEIRAAFHRLAVRYHPDKVHHLGEEFEEMAREKFLALKDAYETLLARGRRPSRG